MKIATIKINNDAYTWIMERAEYIHKSKFDIINGEEYKIAWAQYKNKFNKKAELFTGFYEEFDKENKENYLEVYKNPTSKEIADIKKQDEYDSVRGVILNDGTIYAWPGMVVHDQINSLIDTNIPISNVLRFSFEENWIIDLHGMFTKEEGLELMRKNESILSQFGNVQAEYFIYHSSDVDESYLDLTYNDVYKKVAKKKF